MSRLNVELYGSLLGTLSRRENGFDFEADPGALIKYQLSSTIMSLTVPLNPRYTATQKKRADNFFKELLPEGRNYEWLLQSLPRGERTPYDMLRRYGKDLAGALIIYDPEEPSSYTEPKAEPIDEKKIRYLLEHMPQAALANSYDSGKTSLGGYQGKIVLARKGESWYRVHNGYPSTHILKPISPEYPTMIYDEAFCMLLAYKAGLTGHPAWIENFDGTDTLVIERYDRNDEIGGSRIHQEDFNQVLGAGGSEKYQENGGKVSAKRIAQTLARFGKDEDVKKFASQLIFAIAIGNLDMHAKNVSILHLPDGTVSLAPVYDQVPLRHHGFDGRMALAIGGEYIHANISLTDIASELASWQCRDFADNAVTISFIRKCLENYDNALDNVMPVDGAYPYLKAEISSFISNLLSGKNAGA